MRSTSFSLLFMILISACASQEPKPVAAPPVDSVVISDRPPSPADTTQREYSIIANGQRIALKMWETEIDLRQILGAPLTANVRVLGESADTHMGASIKTFHYPGLKIELYVPKGKDTGWIQNMTVTGKQYQSLRGSRIGDSAKAVKLLYPEGSKFPDGRKGSAYAWHISDGGHNSVLKFEIVNEQINEILLYYEMP